MNLLSSTNLRRGTFIKKAAAYGTTGSVIMDFKNGAREMKETPHRGSLKIKMTQCAG